MSYQRTAEEQLLDLLKRTYVAGMKDKQGIAPEEAFENWRRANSPIVPPFIRNILKNLKMTATKDELRAAYYAGYRNCEDAAPYKGKVGDDVLAEDFDPWYVREYLPTTRDPSADSPGAIPVALIKMHDANGRNLHADPAHVQNVGCGKRENSIPATPAQAEALRKKTRIEKPKQETFPPKAITDWLNK